MTYCYFLSCLAELFPPAREVATGHALNVFENLQLSSSPLRWAISLHRCGFTVRFPNEAGTD
jgi:hypothetical protein